MSGSEAEIGLLTNEQWASKILEESADSLTDNLDELGGALQQIVNKLLPRASNDADIVEHRQLATDYLVHLLNEASQALEAYREKVATTPPSEQPIEPPAWVRQTAQFFDTVATAFLFCIEHHAQDWAAVEDGGREQDLQIWWERVEPILDALLAMPHPQVAYYIIEGLGHLVDLDVQRSLRWIRRVTLASVPQGLTIESLAADHTIDMLAGVLAEHKGSLATSTELRSDLVQTLEAYLQVGWPKAIELAIQLDSIFK